MLLYDILHTRFAGANNRIFNGAIILKRNIIMVFFFLNLICLISAHEQQNIITNECEKYDITGRFKTIPLILRF